MPPLPPLFSFFPTRIRQNRTNTFSIEELIFYLFFPCVTSMGRGSTIVLIIVITVNTVRSQLRICRLNADFICSKRNENLTSLPNLSIFFFFFRSLTRGARKKKLENVRPSINYDRCYYLNESLARALLNEIICRRLKCRSRKRKSKISNARNALRVKLSRWFMIYVEQTKKKKNKPTGFNKRINIKCDLMLHKSTSVNNKKKNYVSYV